MQKLVGCIKGAEQVTVGENEILALVIEKVMEGDFWWCDGGVLWWLGGGVLWFLEGNGSRFVGGVMVVLWLLGDAGLWSFHKVYVVVCS